MNLLDFFFYMLIPVLGNISHLLVVGVGQLFHNRCGATVYCIHKTAKQLFTELLCKFLGRIGNKSHFNIALF